jgi:Fic family protein
MARLHAGFPFSDRLFANCTKNCRHEAAGPRDNLSRFAARGTGLAALAHAQFAAIHPFLDRDGRVGRLLIPLLLCGAGVLQQPLLYWSLYLMQHRDEYYRLLERVRTTGDGEAWLDFFLEGVTSRATSAVETAPRLVALFCEDMARARSAGRRAATMLNVLQALRERPVLTVNAVSRRTGCRFRPQ